MRSFALLGRAGARKGKRYPWPLERVAQRRHHLLITPLITPAPAVSSVVACLLGFQGWARCLRNNSSRGSRQP